MFARIHDLLEIDAEQFLEGQGAGPAAAPTAAWVAESLGRAPAWVAESLREAPFVVVRRGGLSGEDGIPVGVRGARRNERWAGVCDPSVVRAILTPRALLNRMVAESATAPASRAASPGRLTSSARADAIPALRSLPLLAERWRALDSCWGPGGSVGFELATGRNVATSESDLDVVIYAARPMAPAEARALLDSAQGLPAAVDIRVETPICGFSLAEYANRAPSPILLRVADGTVLGTDPWARLGTKDQRGPAGSSRTAYTQKPARS